MFSFFLSAPQFLLHFAVSICFDLVCFTETNHPTTNKLHLCKEALVHNSTSTTLSTTLTKCTAWEFDMNDKMGNTWISEWSLVCDSSYLRTFAETVFLLGVASGGVISGYLSDRFGRKRLLFLSVVLQTIFGENFFLRNFCTFNSFAFLLCDLFFVVRSNEAETHLKHLNQFLPFNLFRFCSVRTNIVSRPFGVARPTRRLFRVGDIRRTHSGH